MKPTPRQLVIGGAVLILTTIGAVAGAVAQLRGASSAVVAFALLAAVVGGVCAWRSLRRLHPPGRRGNGWLLIVASLGGLILVSAPKSVQTVVVSGLAGFLVVASPTVCRRLLVDRRREERCPEHKSPA